MDIVNKWLMLAANLGVIAGIIFLSIEISQNNEALEAQARMERTESASGFFLTITNNSELAAAILKSRRAEELTPTETLQVQAFSSAIFSVVLGQYQEILLGRLSPQEVVLSMRVTLDKSPFIKDSWESSKVRYPPDFIEWFEQNILTP